MKPEPPFKTYLQPDNKKLFQIFDNKELNIDWKNVSILDYGCNQGNFLNSAANNIDNKKYLGIDIILMAIETAKVKHPNQKFIHYDKWHQSWNPDGNKKIKVSDVIDEKFDVIICYSVFTHNTIEQTKEELNDLKKLLNPKGVILFTIWRSEIFEPFHKWILERFEKVVPIDFSTVKYNKMAYWVDTAFVITDTFNYKLSESNSFNSYYNLEWFKEEIKPAVHLGIHEGQHQDLFCLKN
jgi:2-polyprenyl-3-methyl-5-hydroxy-6-metoxy-1,4-benzoquinol methylase